jgi:hypothetical protein
MSRIEWVRKIKWKEERSILSTFKYLHKDLGGVFVETEVSKSSALVLIVLINRGVASMAIKVHVLICGFRNVLIGRLVK